MSIATLTIVAPDLWWVPTSVSNAYLWRARTGGLTVVDPGMPGDESIVLEALGQIGSAPRDVERIVLTHFHSDHAGATTALVRHTGAQVAAGRRDAAVLRGDEPEPMPILTDTERPIYEQLAGKDTVLPAVPCAVDIDLEDDDPLDADGRLRVIAVPGHTWGSVAIHIPHRSAVLTGDVAITTPFGQTSLGPFNVDRAQARQAVRRLAALGTETGGLGHGEPLLSAAASALHHAVDAFADTP